MWKAFPYRLFFVVTFIHAFWFLLALHYEGIYLKDSYEYLNQAKNLVNYGSWYSADWNAPLLMDYFSFRPPLYGLFIAACKWIFNTDYTVLFVQNLLSIINIMLIYRIAVSEGAAKNSTVKVIIISLLFFPTQLIMANMIMSEILFQTLILLLFYCCLLYQRKSNIQYLFYISILLSLLLLTKPVSLLLGVVVAGWLVYHHLKDSQLQQQSFSYIRFIVLLIVPLTFHLICLQQKHQTGYYHYTSMQPVNQQKFNARFTLANKFGEDYAEQWNDSCKTILASQTDYAARYQLMQQMGTDVIKTYPFTFAKLYIKGCFVFLLDPGRHDLAEFFKQQDNAFNGLFYDLNAKGFSAIGDLLSRTPVFMLVLLGCVFCWNILVCIALLLFVFKGNIAFPVKLLLVLFVAYFIAATGLLGVARYRVAVYPELLLCCIFAFDTFQKIRAKKQNHA